MKDEYINYIQHDLDKIATLLIIAITKYIDKEDAFTQTLAGVALESCNTLARNIKKHYEE